MNNATFVLVAIKGKMHQVVKEGSISFCQSQRTIFKGDRNWKGWTFQVRNKEAYKATPILTKKVKAITKSGYHNPQRQYWQPYKD
jgi:hypothetical protein